MRICKKISLCIIISAVLFVAVYFAVIAGISAFIDLNRYKTSIAAFVENETGFKARVEDISFKKSCEPYLKVHLSFAEVLYPDNQRFLKIDEADLKIKILPLIMKKLVIKEAKLANPVMDITIYKDFSTSIEKYINKNKAINLKQAEFDNSNILCKNYKINFKDESISKTFYLEGGDLFIKELKADNKAHIMLKGAIYGQKTKYINYDMDIISDLTGKERLFTFSPFKPLLNSDIKADISGILKADKENNITGSLKIDNLSLKSDDKIISDSKADLTFNGSEVLINSIINTSETGSAEVKGKLVFGKKKYIDLNTRAQNIKIENLAEIISEISKILNIKNPLGNIKAKGIVNADFNIKSDFKKLKSSGNAAISNAAVSHKKLPCPILNINASLNLDNNKILINKAEALINQTRAKIEGVINEDVSFNIKADFENINFENKKYNLPLFVKSLVLNAEGNQKKYKGKALCRHAQIHFNGEKISADEFKFSFDENKVIIPENSVSSPFDIKISGKINDYMKKTFSGAAEFKGDISAATLADLIKPEIKLPCKAAGKIASNGRAEFTGSNINIKAQLKADKDNYISYAVIKELLNKPSVLNIDCEITDKYINIKDMSLSENTDTPVKMIYISGGLEKEKEAIMKNIKLVIPKTLTIAANLFGGEEIALNAELLLNKSVNKPEITGGVKILKYNIKKYLTSIKNADVSFSPENIRIIAPDITVNDSYFNIIADLILPVDINNIIVSNMRLNSINLNVNHIYEAWQKEKNPLEGRTLTLQKGIAAVNNFKLADLKARDISCDFQLKDNILKLSDIHAGAYNGKIEGKADFDIKPHLLNLNIKGKGLDIKQSLYDLCKLDDNLGGKADFTAQVSMRTGEYKQVIQSLNGTVNFSAVDGKMGTLGKFEYYLYAQNLLYHGILNAALNRIADTIIRDNTAEYKHLEGSVLFQNGYLLTNGIKTAGINMSLYIKGKHNLITNQVNIDIMGRISDEVKSKLGSFGNISISEIFRSARAEKKEHAFMTLGAYDISQIPSLYNGDDNKSNTFKVNIYGNINSLSSINSFMWVMPDLNEYNEQPLPDFSDIMQEVL